MARLPRFRLRWLAYALGGLIALVGITLIVLHSPPVREYALRKVAELLQKEGIRFESSRLDYNLLDLNIGLSDLTVRSTATPDLPPVATIGSLRVDLGLRDLIGGSYKIEDAVIRDAKLHVVIDEKGRNNLPVAQKKEEKPSEEPLDFVVDKLALTNASVIFEDRQRNIRAELPAIEATVDGNPLTKSHEIVLATQRASQVNLEGRVLPIDSLRLDAVADMKSAEVKRLEMRTGKSQFAVSGTVKDFANPEVDVKLDSSLNLTPLVEFAGIQQKLSGDVDADISATGKVPNLKVTARVTSPNLSIQQFDRLRVDLQSTYDMGQQKVFLTSFDVTSPAGRVEGNGTVALTTAAGQSSVNARIDGFDLHRASGMLELPVQVASRASGTVEASWPGLQFQQAAANANLRLAATRQAAARNLLPVSGAIAAQYRGGAAKAQVSNVQIPGTRVDGTVTVDANKQLGGEVTLLASDLRELTANLAAFQGKPPADAPAVAGSATLTAKLGGTVNQPRVATTLSAPDLQLATLKGVAIDAQADYGDDRVVLRNAIVRWGEQSITASGTVGLRGAQPLDLTANIERASLRDVLAGIGRSDLPVEGIVTAQAKVGGTVDNPSATLVLTAAELMAYREPLGALNVNASLANQVVNVSDLRLNKQDGVLSATAQYDLRARSYSVDANGKDLRLLQLTLPDAMPVRGLINLAAKGSGTVDDPQLGLTLDVDELTVRDETIGSLDLAANIAQQRAEVKLAAPAYNVNLNATSGTRDPYPTQFTLALKGTDLSKLPLKMERPLEGTVTATIEGAGDAKNFQQGKLLARVENLVVTADGKTLRTEGPMVARYENRLLTVDPSVISGPGTRVEIAGTLPLEQPAQPGELRVRGTADLATLLPVLQPNTNMVVRGEMKFNADIRGTMKRFDPTATVALENGYFDSAQLRTPATGITLLAQVKDGSVLLERAGLTLGDGTIEASGEVPLGILPGNLPFEIPRKQGNLRAALAVKQLSFGSFTAVPQRVAGVVTLRADAEAPRPDLESLTAKLVIDELSTSVGNLRAGQASPSQVTVANGVARIDRFEIQGPDTRLSVAGTAGLTGARPLDIKVDGSLDAALITLFSDAVQASGQTTIQLAVRGTAADPQPTGSIQMADGQLGLRQPSVAAEDIALRVALEGQRVNIERLTASLNGGTLEGSGTVQLVPGSVLPVVDIRAKATDVFLDFPEGLKTVSNSDISIRNEADNIVLGGKVNIVEGSYTEPVTLETGLMRFMQSGREIELTKERSPLLSRLRFNVSLNTSNPIVIDNNRAEAEITMDARLTGDYYQPGLVGRVQIEEGGELNLRERTYVVDRGILTFTNERRIEPAFDILARTQASGYDITMQVEGDLKKTETTLTSDPPLPEPDIIAILLTGRTLEEVRGAEVDVAKEQMFSYLTGAVGGALSEQLQQTLGLSQVRIEPNLIANETDPTARLTLGQDLTRQLSLIYSMDLRDSSDQIYVLEYDLTKRFTTRGTRQDDGSLRMDFRHDLRFGGNGSFRNSAERREQRRIGTVKFTGNPPLPEEEVADKFGVEAGDRYDFFKIRKGLNKLEKTLLKQDLLESRVRTNRELKPSIVDLEVRIAPGPKVDFIYEGWLPSDGVQKRIREAWHKGVFDAQRTEDAREELLNALVKDDYLKATVRSSVTLRSPERKRVLFEIFPGARYHNVKLAFEGVKGIEADELKDLLDDQKLGTAVYVHPERVRELLTGYYRERGFLDVAVKDPRFELDETTHTGRVVLPVEEGPEYKVGSITVDGNSAIDDGALIAAMTLKPGATYRPDQREESLIKIQEAYERQGYNDAEITYALAERNDVGQVDLTFQVTEGKQGVVEGIQISGNENVSQSLIRTQVKLADGDILDLSKLSRSRRNLYNTGAFSLVDIEREPVESGANAGPNQQGVRLNVKLQEIQPWELKYGAFFDTERGPGAIVDIANRNSLGSARVLGFRTRYDADLRESRLYFSQPLLQRFPVRTIGAIFVNQERRPAFITERQGFSAQQEARWRDIYVFNYGYRFERTRTFDRDQDALIPFDERLRTGALTATLTRETRDDILDATRGDFMSQAFEWGPSQLGSQIKYVRYFGQYSRYFPLSEPVDVPMQSVKRHRLVYATAVRGGLANGFGQELIESQRFFAGGSTSIRGFEQDFVGPLNLRGLPSGGEAVFVLNNEIRFPLIHIFDGVGFVDVGNVYEQWRDFNPFEVRKAAGLGLRARTPWFLLRLDYGVKLDRKPGEGLGRIFFSIGQAF